MLEYEQSIIVDAPADHVFGFVSNLNNLPRYLPALRRDSEQVPALSSPPETQRDGIAGEMPRSAEDTRQNAGHAYFHEPDAAGYFRVQPTEYIMEWCAETGQHCSGWLEVQEIDDSCEVTVHLSFHPDPLVAERMRADIDNIGAATEAELTSVMSTIKQLCENTDRSVTGYPLS